MTTGTPATVRAPVTRVPRFPATSLRARGSALGAAQRQPLWPVLGVLAQFYAFWLYARLMVGDVLSFVHVGRTFLDANHLSPAINSIPEAQSSIGYDGQFYYFLALDPALARHYMGEFAGFVYARPVYPALSWLLGLGRAELIPYAMLGVNLAAVGGATIALAAWLRRHELSPWFALLYGMSPAVVFSVFRDLTEPLAYALALVAVVVFERRSKAGVAASAALFALAALTRETTAVFPAVCALVLLFGWPDLHSRNLRNARRWLVSAAFLAVAVGPLLLWKSVLALWLDTPTQERPGDSASVLVPFHGLAERWPWNGATLIVIGAVVLPTLATLALMRHVVRQPSAAAIAAGLLVANALCFVVFVPTSVTVDYGASGRAAIGVLIATLLCLPALRLGRHPRTAIACVAFLWSFLWFGLVSVTGGQLPLTVFG